MCFYIVINTFLNFVRSFMGHICAAFVGFVDFSLQQFYGTVHGQSLLVEIFQQRFLRSHVGSQHVEFIAQRVECFFPRFIRLFLMGLQEYFFFFFFDPMLKFQNNRTCSNLTFRIVCFCFIRKFLCIV